MTLPNTLSIAEETEGNHTMLIGVSGLLKDDNEPNERSIGEQENSSKPVVEESVWQTEENTSEPKQKQAVLEENPKVDSVFRQAMFVSRSASRTFGGTPVKRTVCPRGHFYDGGKFSYCPICEKKEMEKTPQNKPESGTEPVGWLIGVKGVYRGKAFECRSGRNRIGRDSTMEICLANDPSISKDRHASLIYDPKRREFYIQPSEDNGLTYKNDALLFMHEQIKPYDRIGLGDAEFVFLPLCGEKFSWDE